MQRDQMRQAQQNRRGRNRGRKPQNPLARNYESNGPDVKIRGTASHIAEKYISLAREALSSGDPIVAENYLQHAEHYNRIIMAAQPQFGGQGNDMGYAGAQPARLNMPNDPFGDGDDEDFDGDGDMDTTMLAPEPVRAPRDQGHRDQGHRDQGHRDQGHRDGSQREPGHRDPNQRDTNQRDTNHRDPSHRERNHRDLAREEQPRIMRDRDRDRDDQPRVDQPRIEPAVADARGEARSDVRGEAGNPRRRRRRFGTGPVGTHGNGHGGAGETDAGADGGTHNGNGMAHVPEAAAGDDAPAKVN